MTVTATDWYDVATRCPECGETSLRARYGLIIDSDQPLDLDVPDTVGRVLSAHEGWWVECRKDDCAFEQEGELKSDLN